MRVTELIAELNKLDADMEVYIDDIFEEYSPPTKDFIVVRTKSAVHLTNSDVVSIEECT